MDGSVFDSAGVPVTASKDIQIKAYDAATAGTHLWTSSVYNTLISSGQFTIHLDASAGSPSLVDRLGERTASQAMYFQVEVDSGAANASMDTPTIVLPRIRAKGTAFALTAASADAVRGVTATVAELNYLTGATANLQAQINTLSGAASSVPTGVSTGRLTLVSATPVPDTDQSAKTTLYLTSGVIDLWDGSQYATKQYDEKSISLAGATVASRMYAVYAYLSSGVPALELEAWTNNTTRATALVQDTNHSRIKYKSGAKDRRWIGDILTNGTGGQTDDTLGFRGVFNAHNRVGRPLKDTEATNSWTYATQVWRPMNNDSTNNRLTVCVGESTRVSLRAIVGGGHYGTGKGGFIGVGINSTSSDAGSIRASGSAYYGYDSMTAFYEGYLSARENVIYPLESAESTSSTTFYGDDGGTVLAAGIVGQVEI